MSVVRKINYKSRRQRKGVVAIEFAIGAFGFFLMIFYWMEVSFMGFVTASVDFAVSESSRIARTADYDNYQDIFTKALKDSGSPWAALIDEDDFKMHVRYFKDVDSLNGCGTNITIDKCGENNSDDRPLAVYQVSYPYQPLFAQLFFDDIGTMNISREVITVQEYERSHFKWSPQN